MGNQCTKVNKNGGAEKGEEGQSNDTPDLSSYQSACEEDPELQRFDSVLQQRTSLALNSISVNTDYRSLSLESLREVTLCFLDMNQGVVNFILESKKDIWKDPDIFDVVKDYLDSSIHIMNFCASLDDCLERAHSSQSIILVALEKFENETKMVVNEGDLKPFFSETLEQLRSFKDVSGDPFTARFFSAFHSVYLQQQALLSKIKSKKSKLDKKLSRVRIWKRVSNIIFATVFVSAIICSIVAAAVTAPPMVTALAAAASVPLGTVGKWINSMWKKYEDELKREREILTTMQAGSFVVIQDLEHIRVLADKLQIIFEGLLQSADFAITRTDALASAMEEVKKNVNGFSETIEVLSQHAKKCNQDIRMARAVILRKIVSQPSSSNQGSGVFLYIQKQSKQAIKEINLHTYKEMEIEKVEKEMKQSKIKKICVFCGSSSGKKSSYKEAAVELGKELVSRNIDLVYGGGSVGLMGLVSQAVYKGGRHVLGVIPTALMPRELTGETVGEVETVADMHQRKAEMAKHSDAFIALPGGYGTLEELLEVITWAQLGIHDKPVGLLNVDGYYNSLLTLIDKAVEEGFIWPKARQIFVSAPTAKELMNKLEEYARSHENVALKLDWKKEEVQEYIPPSNGRYIPPSYIP